MKKKLLVVAVLVVAVFSLTACGQKEGPCESCGEVKPLYEFTIEGEGDMMDSLLSSSLSDKTSYTLCKDCVDEMAEQFDQYEELLGGLVSYDYEKLK